VLTEAQVVALERAKTEKEAHGEFDSEHPGGDRVKVASQCPCISVGAPHLDHGVGEMTFGRQQAG
jgi:hypothetical protein